MQYQKCSIPKRNEYCKIHNMNIMSPQYILNTKLRIDIKTMIYNDWYNVHDKC